MSIAASTCALDTSPQRKQLVDQSGPLPFKAASIAESETVELSVATEPAKDSCA